MRPNETKTYRITDSRDTPWEAKVSGPVKSGSMRPGEDVEDLPDRYIVRFQKLRGSGRVEVDTYTGEYSDDELVALLEDQPEWEHSDF